MLLTKSDLLYKPEDPREPITLRAKDIISIYKRNELEGYKVTSSKDPNGESVTKAFEKAIKLGGKFRYYGRDGSAAGQ